MADFQDVSYNVPVEGEIDDRIPETEENDDDDELSTLDEPVKDTIIRDLKAVGQKFGHIVFPRKSKLLLRDWDLWGPLILCVIMAFLLQVTGANDAKAGSGGPKFAQVFIVVWVGAAIVSLNSQLLGGNMSFFQSVCVLGYCMFPLVVAMIICWLIVHTLASSPVSVAIRILATTAAYGWSVYASIAFLGDSQPKGRKALAVFPICLFYFILGWMVVTYT